ncbi:hypothetical protein CAEBREN_17340 [Caenorhabditis brenneri]|uniref:Uncharacterized protein n=1 Tax=Caenorhabditis brenneri TaxID=135651 RepID=G0NGC3_CAEBE|nr:hypothetical protein CAEBREN_17340 [Caenorhabditis brenneri]
MKIIHTLLLLLPLLVNCGGGASTEKPHGSEEVHVHHAYFKNAAHLEQVLGVKFPKSANGKETVSGSADSTTTLDENHILSNILPEPNSTTTDFPQSPLQVSPNAASQSLLAEKDKTTTISTSFTNFSQASDSSSTSPNLSSNYSESMIPTSQISTSPFPSASDDHSTNPATIIPESADPTPTDSSPSVFPPTSDFNASPFATDSSTILPHRKSKCLMPIRLGVHTSTTTTIRVSFRFFRFLGIKGSRAPVFPTVGQ